MGDHQIDAFDMRARRDFGYDAAIGPMRLDLAPDDIGEDLTRAVRAPADDRRRRVVAARLDPEDECHVWYDLHQTALARRR
ncbi:MAG: hypothetical protein R3C54_16190 [Parvularculaceae bacterium]